jgi:hypothetical protein
MVLWFSAATANPLLSPEGMGVWPLLPSPQATTVPFALTAGYDFRLRRLPPRWLDPAGHCFAHASYPLFELGAIGFQSERELHLCRDGCQFTYSSRANGQIVPGCNRAVRF